MGVLRETFGTASLARRIFFVAAASILPLTVLLGITLLATARGQRERLLDAHVQNALTLSAAIDAQFENDIAALDALASSPRLELGDFAGLQQVSLELLERRTTWLNVVISTAQGREVMNARLPLEDVRPSRVAPEDIAAAVSGRQPVISNLAMSLILQRQTFGVHVPVELEGEVRYVVTAEIAPESLSRLVQLHAVTERGVVTIVDRNQRVVARSREAEQWLGRSASGPLLERLRGGEPRGRVASVTLEGAPVYSAYHRSAFSGWSAIIGMPRDVIDAPHRWMSLASGASIVISVLLGLLAAARVGRTILGPMRELEASAASVGHGELPQMPRTRLAEVRRVGEALVSAHLERQRALERERDARQLAERASQAKDEFLAMLGHELRNPLAAIATASLLLERSREGLPPAQANAAAIVSRQVRHLARMTDDLLDAGRVALGKVALTRTRMDLGHAVRTVMTALRDSGQLDRHDVSLSAGAAWIDGDPTRIEQITLNLVTNALKYTPDGGSIRVEVAREADQAVLRVSDTGIGLDAELLPRVFDLFVQGERAIDRSQGGLGIGLTLVRRLAELHGGSAQAASAGPGMGATFTVSFPAVDPSMAAAAPAAVRKVAPLRIALVEDNEDVRTGLRHLLESDGHTVREAADGRSGLQLVLSDPHLDAALVDVGLPGMDGLELARAVRQSGRSRLLLVAMTGYGGEMDKARGIEAGFDAYLVKPVDPDDLKRLLESRR